MADGLGQQNSRKDDQVILNREADTKALLDENTNVSSAHGMLHYHGWNAGILSIGTFGLLKDDLSIMIKNGEHKEYFGFIDKDGQDRGEKWVEGQEAEEYCHQDADADADGWEDDNMMSTIDVEDYQDSDVEGEWNPLLYDCINGGGTGGGAPRSNAICAITINPAAADHNINVNGAINIDDSLQYYDEVNKKKERTTLAELFSAESEHDDDDDDDEDGDAIIAKHNCRKVPPKSKYSINKKPAVISSDGAQKNGLAVGKKVIPKVKEDGSRPMQKLQGVSNFYYLEIT